MYFMVSLTTGGPGNSVGLTCHRIQGLGTLMDMTIGGRMTSKCCVAIHLQLLGSPPFALLPPWHVATWPMAMW